MFVEFLIFKNIQKIAATKMDSKHKEFLLNLSKGVDFIDIPHNYQTIYTNFHLLFYMTDIWSHKILSQTNPNTYIFRLYGSKNHSKQTYQIEEVARSPFKCQYEEPLVISYKINKICDGKTQVNQSKFYSDLQQYLQSGQKSFTKVEPKQQFQINVKFQAMTNLCSMYARVNRCAKKVHECTEEIVVKIEDKQCFFQSIYERLHQCLQKGDRTSLSKQINAREFEYFYKEPYDVRYHAINQEHFSIALQGGGVKGISYIGVYQALKNIYQKNTYSMLKSIIGSSAGAILSLAIVCNLTQEESINIVSSLSTVASTDKTNLEEGTGSYGKKWVEFEKQTMDGDKLEEIIEEILVGYGIIDKEVFQFLKGIVENENIAAKIIELLEAWNSQIGQLFIKEDQEKRKSLTLLRILNNNMMTGKTIQKIACDCLTKVFPEVPYQNLCAITFQQLYEKTGIELTCTGVDLTDKVIRFFNQKTTPTMPVASAIHISGSFPVAFVGQKWKKQWGKYHIHYDNTRRQLDLTNHLFTDGGLLSNFPIKYLDNEKMRPMYFKHMKNPGKTKIYGFGLFHIENDEDYMKEKQKKSDRIIGELIETMKKQIGLCKIMKYYLCGCISEKFKKCLGTDSISKNIKPKRQGQINTRQYIDQIDSIQHVTYTGFAGLLRTLPIVDLLFNLLDTFFISNTNIVKECFMPECFNIQFPSIHEIKQNDKFNPQIWLKPYDHQKYISGIQSILSSLKNLKPSQNNSLKQKHHLTKASSNIIENLTYLQESLKTKLYDLKQNEVIDFAMRINSLVSGLYYEMKIQIDSSEDKQCLLTFQNFISELNEMCSEKYFYRQNIKRDGQKMLKIIEVLLTKIKQPSQSISLSTLKLFNKEYRSQQNLLSAFTEYYQRLKLSQSFIPLPIESLLDWTRRQNFQTLCLYENYQQKLSEVEKLVVPQLSIARYGIKVKNKLRDYVNKMLHKAMFDKIQCPDQNRNIHLILESKHVAEYYFNEFIFYCEEAIFNFNRMKKLSNKSSFKIASMTCSSYQSLAAILHASQLPKDTINDYIWKIRHSIEAIETPVLNEEFSKHKWAMINKKLILQIEQQTWRNRFDFLSEVRKKYGRQERNDGKVSDQWILQQFNNKDALNDAFEKTLNYTLNKIEESETLPIHERLEWLRKEFSVSKGGQRNYYEQTMKQNQRVVQFYEYLMEKFGELAKYSLILSCNIAFPIMEHIHDPATRKQAWKGVIMGKVLKSLKLKSLIKMVLKQIGLEPDATLNDFFISSKKKMLINFLVVEIMSQKLIFLNHKTRPNMPIWAAVIASSSLPYLFEPQMDFKSWKQRYEEIDQRFLKNYFQKSATNQTENSQNYLQSGVFLTKLPLELITNEKIRKHIGAKKNETFLTFTFNDFAHQISDHILFESNNNLKIRPFTMYELLKLSRQYTTEQFKEILNGQTIQYQFDSLKLLIDSQDNTFLSLYEAESLQIPTKLSTLDFYRIKEDDGNYYGASKIIKECIKNAQYIAYQKIHNNDPKRKDPCCLFMKIKCKSYQQKLSPKQVCYDQISIQETNSNIVKVSRMNEACLKSKKVLKVEFPSAIVEDFYHITQRYRIFYRLVEPDQIIQRKKMNRFEKRQDEKWFKEIQKYYFTFEADPSRLQSLVFDIKIVYVIKEADRFKLTEVYHRIDIKDFLSHKINQNELFTYRLEYGEFYGKNGKIISPHHKNIEDCSPENIFEPTIKVSSFNSFFWEVPNICDSCGQMKKPMKLIQSKKTFKFKCFNRCTDKNFVIYQCQNQICLAKYCLSCKYRLCFDSQTIKCFLGHELQQKFTVEMEKQEPDREGPDGPSDLMRIRICNFCGVYSPVLYHDSGCAISICDMCKTSKYFQNN